MFPLSSVLFPGAELPLHVFEPRYRELVADCLDGDGEFGVVLIARGSEVGGGDERFGVGTVAHIVSASPLADGRWALLAVGTRRFAVEHWLDDDPYPRAVVCDMAGGPVPGDEARLEEATAAVRRVRTLLSELGSPAPVADLGAGEGLISQLLARNAKQVWCIDNSPRMIEVGTELAKRNELSNLAYKLGDIEQVPLPDGSVDLAILSQALHHARHPQKAVDEAYRILKPGGQLLVLDLAEHNFEKARELYADLWLGFKESALDAFLKKAKFVKVEVTPVSTEAVEPYFQTLLASGTKA